MLDLVGTVPRVVVSGTLWLLVAPLLLGLGLQALGAVYARGDLARMTLERRASAARFIGLACVGFVTGVALAHAYVLWLTPRPGRAYVESIASGIRVGAADASIALLFDGPAAAACVFACAIVLAIAVWLAVQPAARRGPEPWAALQLALVGALVSFLADGLMAVMVGWGLAIAAGAWLAGWKNPRAGAVGAVRGVAALAALALGASWLFWASAGTWDGREFSVRQPAGFFAVGSPASPPGAATLTLTHAPGAAVYLDEERVPLATAPFVDVPVPHGFHTLRVRLGHGSGDQDAELVVDVDVPQQGESIQLVPSGPSLSPRDFGLSLVAKSDGSARWTPEPVAVTAVLCMWVMAAWWVSVPPTVADAPAPLAIVHGVTTALVGPFWLARASELLGLAPRMKLVLPGAVAAILVVAIGVLWAAGRSDSRAIEATVAAFESTPARLGLVLVRFERWVLDALVRVGAGLFGVAGWVAGRFDSEVLSRPGQAAAGCTVRIGHRVESIVGISMGKLAWALVGLAAAAVAAHGLWNR